MAQLYEVDGICATHKGMQSSFLMLLRTKKKVHFKRFGNRPACFLFYPMCYAFFIVMPGTTIRNLFLSLHFCFTLCDLVIVDSLLKHQFRGRQIFGCGSLSKTTCNIQQVCCITTFFSYLKCDLHGTCFQAILRLSLHQVIC